MTTKHSRFLALLAAVAVAACGDTTGAGAPKQPWAITLIGGHDVIDTIDAQLDQPLEVELRDADGQPVPDVPLTLTSSVAFHPVLSAPVGGDFSSSTSIRTDALGRARVQVRFGSRTGAAGLSVSDSVGNPGVTATYTVAPGAAVDVEIFAGRDAMFVGHSLSLGAAVSDRAGNARPELPELSADPAIFDFGTASTATAIGAGVAMLRAEFGMLRDSVEVTVVPNPTIAAAWATTSGSPGGVTRVYTMRADGTERKEIMAHPSFFEPYLAWMPDGQRIVFTLGRHFPQLHVITPTGITDFAASSILESESQPRFSRDGSWAYFTGLPSTQNAELWRVKADGSAPQRVGRVAGLDDVDSDPDPSPDGTKLVYATHRTDPGMPTLRFLDLGTGEVVDPGIPGLGPRWSPDGTRIAYIPTVEEWGYIQTTINYYCPCDRLMVMNADGTEARSVLAAKDSIAPVFDWLPDGNHVLAVFNGGIGVVNVTNGKIVRAPNTEMFLSPTPKP